MGIMELSGMDKEPNRGGRPPKDDDDGTRDVDGNPFTNDDGEEYWRIAWEQYYSEGTETLEALLDVCDYAYVQPRVAIYHIHQHEIHNFKQYDEWDRWERWAEGKTENIAVEDDSWISEIQSISEDTDSSSDEEVSSGLSSMLQ